MRLKKNVILGAVVLGMSMLALTGCGKSGNSEEAEELNVQFVPTNNDGSMEAKAKPFAEYLTCEISFVKTCLLSGSIFYGSNQRSDRHQRRHLRTHHCHCRRYRRYRPHHATPAGKPSAHAAPRKFTLPRYWCKTRQVESRLEHRIRSHEHSQRLHRGLWSGL